MHVEREEVPFCTVKLESKLRTHDLFESRVGRILAQLEMKDFLDLENTKGHQLSLIHKHG